MSAKNQAPAPLPPRARAVADACGDYLANHRHGAAPAPRPCPPCQGGKPRGGWLRPVTGRPGRWRCSKCGRAVYIRPEKGRKGER